MNECEISILLLCNPGDLILHELKEHLYKVFRCRITISPYNMDLTFSFNKKRQQFIAEKIIEQAALGKKNLSDKWLLIVDADLYSPGLNFIFGLADIQSGISIVSITRLKQEFYGLSGNQKLFLERLKKESTHELGHLFLLRHCPDKKCVMRFSNSIYDTDEKLPDFCETCKRSLKFYRQ